MRNDEQTSDLNGCNDTQKDFHESSPNGGGHDNEGKLRVRGQLAVRRWSPTARSHENRR